MIGDNLRFAGSGERVALLTDGRQYFEVLQKEEDDVVVQSWNAQRQDKWSRLETRGFVPVLAVKIIKGNGTVMYSECDQKVPRWFIAGEVYRVEPKKLTR